MRMRGRCVKPTCRSGLITFPQFSSEAILRACRTLRRLQTGDADLIAAETERLKEERATIKSGVT